MGHSANEIDINVDGTNYNLASFVASLNNEVDTKNPIITCGWTGWYPSTCITNCGMANNVRLAIRLRCVEGVVVEAGTCGHCDT